MTNLVIKDLDISKELDAAAMRGVKGGVMFTERREDPIVALLDSIQSHNASTSTPFGRTTNCFRKYDQFRIMAII